MLKALLKKGGMVLFNEKKREVMIVTRYRMIMLSYDEFISQLKEEFKDC